jgi:hypothetical protein
MSVINLRKLVLTLPALIIHEEAHTKLDTERCMSVIYLRKLILTLPALIIHEEAHTKLETERRMSGVNHIESPVFSLY